jgi:hypothetical protein
MKNLITPAVLLFSVTLIVGLIGTPQALYG